MKSLPDNLGEAVAIAEESELVRRALGEHAFTRFINVKKAEWEEYRMQVTRYELDKLLPIL
ncbi:MAG TPA: hypothetical protein PK745_18030 [bacterium]|nr:hypothetical protein [bacterium]